MRFVVALISIMLAFSLNAQPLNLDPETTNNVSAMSEKQSVRVPQRARVPQMEPTTVEAPFQGMVIVWPASWDGVGGVSFHVYTPLLVGSTISWRILSFEGVVILDGTTGPLSVPGSNWAGWMWHGAFPVDWPTGVATFEMVVNKNGRLYSAIAKTIIGVTPAGSNPPLFGPLESAEVDSMGGVILHGLFRNSPVVAFAPGPNEAATLEGWNYLPPSLIGTGLKLIGVCSGIDGDDYNLECSTTTLVIPSR